MQPEQSVAREQWSPHPELTRTCEVCKAPPGFACVRKGTWYVAKLLSQPHPGRRDA